MRLPVPYGGDREPWAILGIWVPSGECLRVAESGDLDDLPLLRRHRFKRPVSQIATIENLPCVPFSLAQISQVG
jgi:hypothetical protein